MKKGSRHRPKNGFSLWLEERCREEGLSDREAAARTGLSHSTIAFMKRGTKPTPESIRKLAAAFSNNGVHQRQVLEDYLLTLCGYRSQRDGELSEPLARLVDKLQNRDEIQIRLIEEFADYVDIVKAGKVEQR